MGIIVYPSKFTTLTDAPGTVISKGDVTTKILYGIYTAKTNGSQSWKYQSLVFQSALRLFGDFNQWTNMQLNDKNITGYNLKFLKETLAFIAGTPRTMSAIVWKDVMENYNSSYYSVSVDANIKANNDRLYTASTPVILTDWIRQRNGFDDLITSLYVLFGSKYR